MKRFSIGLILSFFSHNAVFGQHCDSAGYLMSHVYNHQRLHIINKCYTIHGKVVKVIHEPDGDAHLMIDTGGVSPIVAEIIYAYEPKSHNSLTTYFGYKNKIPVPNLWQQVTITGYFVWDSSHLWFEIHPVSFLSTP